jgi:hypothetical protein
VVSADAAAASYDSFDDRYLGSKASAPTLDNDGNALLTGALYWNTGTNMMNVWTGSAWSAVSITNPTLAAISDGTLGAFSHRNKIINGNFAVNQRAVSGTVVLAAGVYGHDRWKAGAGGCTYTFATSANVTTLTITAGTLMQVIEGANLLSGTHVLTWTGTATARVDSGSYGASGLTGTATGGTNQTIEFATGTVSKVQYEPGSVATPFEHRPYATEFSLCQRYYQVVGGVNSAHPYVEGYGVAGSFVSATMPFQVPTRTTNPTVTIAGTWAVLNCAQPSRFSGNDKGFTLYSAVTGTGRAYFYPNSSDDIVTIVDEL